jgi:acetylornithine deacetylase/succinyl-diaminopimelate desuccinylase-like protein
VLPGKPLNDWNTPPFTPTVRGHDLYARGASDDKGQLFCHVKAIESHLRTIRTLPLNVKCVFEGDEEIGSPYLLPLVARNKHALRADAAIASDTRMLSPNRPAISFAQRGGLRAEVEVTGPKQELHSGTFGGVVLNPIQALSEIIAGFHDESGRIAIPGFYDDVREWSTEERRYMARTGPSDDKILRDAHVEEAWGETGFNLYERTTIRPALIFNGIAGGHHGPGVKGVIPRRATAKLSFRLVPDQDPARVAQLFREHILRVKPSGVGVAVRTSSPVDPALIDRSHPAVRTVMYAYKKGFGALPVFLRSGGSIPVVSAFHKHLGIPTVLMGFGLPDDHIHAANERFHLPNFYRGIETSIWYFAMAARTLQPQEAERLRNRQNVTV